MTEPVGEAKTDLVRCGMCQDMVSPADCEFLDYPAPSVGYPEDFNTDEKFIVCKWCTEYAYESVGIPAARGGVPRQGDVNDQRSDPM